MVQFLLSFVLQLYENIVAQQKQSVQQLFVVKNDNLWLSRVENLMSNLKQSTSYKTKRKITPTKHIAFVEVTYSGIFIRFAT